MPKLKNKNKKVDTTHSKHYYFKRPFYQKHAFQSTLRNLHMVKKPVCRIWSLYNKS